MIFKVGKRSNKPAPGRGGRVPLNYYRSGPAKTGASPFARKRTQKGRARKYFIRGLDIVVVILLLCGLVYSLLVRSTPRVVLNDTTYHSLADYKSAAAKELSALKNRNKITLNEPQIISSLQKQFPEIANASLELPLFSETPIIHLSIAKPSFFLSSNGVNYVIDSQGVATAASHNLPQIKNLITLTDQSGFNARPGDRLLSAQSVDFINAVLAQTAHAKLSIKSLVLPAQAEELDLYTTDRGYFVKFYLGGDPALQAGQFLATRHNFDQTGKQPSSYIDVRVPGKIFYK